MPLFAQTTYTLKSSCTTNSPGDDCDWSSGTSWVGGVAPMNATPSNGDIIVIPTGTFVQIEEESISITNNVTLQLYGVLYVYSQGAGGVGDLILSAGSTVQIATSGDIRARQTGSTGGGGGNVNRNFLRIGSNQINGSSINGLASPNQLTESSLGSGGGCAETGTCEEDPLPIEIGVFKALTLGNNVKIIWSTLSQINNDYFTIERSSDGLNYQSIATVAGAGNSSEELEYSYVDSNPLFGRSYYRLKQTDFDGASETFAPVAVDFTSLSNGDITFTNPVRSGEEVTVYANTDETENLKLTVFNMVGEKIIDKNFSGVSYSFQLDADIRPGIYFVRISSVNSEKTGRLLIQ